MATKLVEAEAEAMTVSAFSKFVGEIATSNIATWQKRERKRGSSPKINRFQNAALYDISHSSYANLTLRVKRSTIVEFRTADHSIYRSYAFAMSHSLVLEMYKLANDHNRSRHSGPGRKIWTNSNIFFSSISISISLGKRMYCSY